MPALDAAAPRILIIDDDPHIREVVRFALEKAGFATAEAADGRQALERFAALAPDLVVLDVLMPEMDGTRVCRALRARARPGAAPVPIVFLTSKDSELDRVLGLELGGDDYVTKPFSPRELVARLRAVLRRSRETATQGPRALLRHGPLALDLERHQASWGDRRLALTATELGILRTLLGRVGKVFTRDEIVRGAYRDLHDVSDRTVNSHLRHLRRKLAEAGGAPIETVRGIGYRIAEQL